MLYFNSRPSARGDAEQQNVVRRRNYFNSRPSARGDLHLGHFGTDALFQFTPLREGRPPQKRISTLPLIFQFTPLREGRHDAAASAAIKQRFQFTPLREGRRRFCKLKIVIQVHFNSRPSARGDCERLRYSNSCIRFQFTPLREGQL